MKGAHVADTLRRMSHFDELRLETPRLLLRPPRIEDLDAWTEMMQDEPSAGAGGRRTRH